MPAPADTAEILKKYSAKLEKEVGSFESSQDSSKEYEQFKADRLPELSRYERWCKSLGSLISLRASEKDRIKIQRHLDISHLDVTPSQSLTLAAMSLLGIFFLTLLIISAIYLITGEVQLLLGGLGLLASLFVFYYTYTMPERLASLWRLKASAEMVPAVLYIVIYMKHTSNLERAIEFASKHLEGPLATDLKKIFYDVEIGKFSTIKQSLDAYLETWRDYAPEFVESIHIVESSLFEPSEARRIQILEKSLQIILDGIYEKMLRFSRDIRSPLTNIYMLGIILPTLGLALLPLAATLLQGAIQWHHVFIIFNVIIPLGVFYLVSEALLKRPGGYGETSLLEKNPDYPKFISNTPWIIAGVIAIPLLLIGILPFLFQIPFITNTLNLNSDYTFGELGLPFMQETKIFDFKAITKTESVGPFGPLATLLSLFIPLGLAYFFVFSYKRKTQDLIKTREATKELEEEFTNSLFQLGNRIGDGLPAEVAFGRVAEETKGQKTEQFFLTVSQNVQNAGMSLESALFDKNNGALIFYPSQLIATSMKILVESVKKGSTVAAQAMMSISEYIKNIQKINQRLHDLLAEIISDMRSNMTFLAPLLAGIVVGLSAMISGILNKLYALESAEELGGSVAGLGNLGGFTQLFNVTEMIPPYYIQVAIGIYIIEVIFILTGALVVVNSGRDPLLEKSDLAKNLASGLALYLITALVSILALSLLASIALSSIG